MDEYIEQSFDRLTDWEIFLIFRGNGDRTVIYGGRVRYIRSVVFEPVNLERLRNDPFAPSFSLSSISIHLRRLLPLRGRNHPSRGSENPRDDGDELSVFVINRFISNRDLIDDCTFLADTRAIIFKKLSSIRADPASDPKGTCRREYIERSMSHKQSQDRYSGI